MTHRARANRLVIVGASLAGLRAAETARKYGFQDEIVLVGAEEHLPYDRPPLSKAFLDPGDAAVPWLRTERHLTEQLGLVLKLGVPASALDPQSQTVTVGEEAIHYSAMVIATGAAARALPGAAGVRGVHTLRTLDDARAVRSALDAGARTVVIGAGFIGSEIASGARMRGLDVTIVEALDVPLSRSVGPEVGYTLAALHKREDTELRCGAVVTGITEAGGQVRSVMLDDGTELPADLVIAGIGVTPSTGWLAKSGAALHQRDGGLLCDETLWTGLPGVYAAGDVAHWPNALFDGELMRLEHWATAVEQGAAAARNAIGPRGAALSTVPYFWSVWYGQRIQFVGVPQADEVSVVSEPGSERLLALYRRGARLVGCLTVDRPGQIMKYRRMISERASWDHALRFARSARLP
ncbi:FAD-dependent oxidoreductase [Actinoplanes sp. NPDC023936]|uniref:NAD(P)/FAD-dependent oxidoreductase n=1 Tax=Actinoplanes sp. NPDC023936 TaxID=3154910 RepID=UPI0033C18D6D